VLARRLGAALGAPLVAATVTRLLADTNRSPHHRGLFSEWTRSLPIRERERLLELLYDPARPGERSLALRLRRRLSRSGRWRVRLNQPYRGASDGLTTSLRRRFSPGPYLGLELELNQRHVRGPAWRWRKLQSEVVDAFSELVQGEEGRPAHPRGPRGRGGK
jgi:predicted N-formylglutamate amidohydrolase